MDFLDTDEIEFKDIRCDIAGARLIKFTGITFSAKMEKELLFAEGDKPRGTQSGNREYEIKIKMLVGALCDMNDEAISRGYKDILDFKLPVVLRFRAKGARKNRMFRFVNVSISEFELSMMQGDKKMEVELPGTFEDYFQIVT